jgi:hypothetical protein
MNINHRQKQEIMNENKYLCSYDKYKNKNTPITQKYIYNSEIIIPMNISFCTVDIILADIISVAQKFCQMNKFKPVMINIVDKTFNGSNIDILNSITETDIILRSNFYKTINHRNLYPLNEGEIAYAENVLFFRNEKYQEINDIFEISLITISLIKNPILIGEYMLTNDYFSYQKTIEAIFQCAYIAGKDIVIFSDLGVLSYGIPITELIEIINICILKYCTLFKFIIFSIPSNNIESKKIFDILSNKIIKPQHFNEIVHTNLNNQIIQNNQMMQNNQMIHNNQMMQNNQMIHNNQMIYNNQMIHNNQMTNNNQIVN